MKIDHIGIAVPSLSKGEKIFADILDTPPKERETVTKEGINLSCFDLEGVQIELLEPDGPNSKIAKFLENKKGASIHHIAFRVDNLNDHISKLIKKGYKIIEGYPRSGKGNTTVAFMHPKSTGGILIELVQKN